VVDPYHTPAVPHYVRECVNTNNDFVDVVDEWSTHTHTHTHTNTLRVHTHKVCVCVRARARARARACVCVCVNMLTCFLAFIYSYCDVLVL